MNDASAPGDQYFAKSPTSSSQPGLTIRLSPMNCTSFTFFFFGFCSGECQPIEMTAMRSTTREGRAVSLKCFIGTINVRSLGMRSEVMCEVEACLGVTDSAEGRANKNPLL